ncbi:hypothetical protein JTP68_11570 [Dietzia cinnamea]|uniref:hypothetical protein n=1 Tax=Dietzia cinnamea TaxID=321318 RepID=UPI00195EE82D|nr:hypothetical protein [Dietzia cinnamea]
MGSSNDSMNEQFKVAAKYFDCTPDSPVQLAASGYSSPAESVESRLEVSLLLLEDPRGALCVLVSVDFLYPGRRIRQAVEEAFRGIPPSQIVVMASHTHRAPVVDDARPAHGRYERKYTEDLLVKLRQAGLELLQAPRIPVQIRTKVYEANHSVNRRKRKWLRVSKRPKLNQIVMAPNYLGSRDETVTTMDLVDENKKTIAVVWNYACHPVAYGSNAVSSHYPGLIREAIRGQYADSSVPVLFGQGFSGDVRPSASVSARGFRALARTVLTGATFSDMTGEVYRRWAEGLAFPCLRKVSESPAYKPAGELTARRLTAPSSDFVRNPKRHSEVSFQLVEFGGITLIAVSAELVTDYAVFLRRRLPGRHLMLIGCTDDTLGYFPTSRMIEEGGYEASGHCKNFEYDGLQPDLEKKLITKFEELIAELDQPAPA